MDEDTDNMDFRQVHIRAPDEEYETILQAQIKDPEPDHSLGVSEDVDERIVALTRGGDLAKEDEPYEIHGSKEDNHQRTVVKGEEIAIGYYIHTLEQHGYPENNVISNVGEAIDLDDYFKWQQDLSSRDRRLRLLDLMEWRAEVGDDFVAERYLDVGSWRSTDLSESASRLAEDIRRGVEHHPRMCYYSAGEAAINMLDNHRVEYVEGFVLPEQAGQAIRHAWLEIDGEVAEVTWPWHYPDGGDAVYFGTKIGKGVVKEHRRSEGPNGPVILNDEDTDKLSRRI